MVTLSSDPSNERNQPKTTYGGRFTMEKRAQAIPQTTEKFLSGATHHQLAIRAKITIAVAKPRRQTGYPITNSFFETESLHTKEGT